MVIFHSYVKLPEGNLEISLKMGQLGVVQKWGQLSLDPFIAIIHRVIEVFNHWILVGCPILFKQTQISPDIFPLVGYILVCHHGMLYMYILIY